MLGICTTLLIDKVVLAYYVELFGQTGAMRLLHSHAHSPNDVDHRDDEHDTKQRPTGSVEVY